MTSAINAGSSRMRGRKSDCAGGGAESRDRGEWAGIAVDVMVTAMGIGFLVKLEKFTTLMPSQRVLPVIAGFRVCGRLFYFYCDV